MITISNCLLIQTTYLLVIWDLAKIGQFDHINRMITLLVITLSGPPSVEKKFWLLILSHSLAFSQVYVYVITKDARFVEEICENVDWTWDSTQIVTANPEALKIHLKSWPQLFHIFKGFKLFLQILSGLVNLL